MNDRRKVQRTPDPPVLAPTALQSTDQATLPLHWVLAAQPVYALKVVGHKIPGYPLKIAPLVAVSWNFTCCRPCNYTSAEHFA